MPLTVISALLMPRSSLRSVVGWDAAMVISMEATNISTAVTTATSVSSVEAYGRSAATAIMYTPNTTVRAMPTTVQSPFDGVTAEIIPAAIEVAISAVRNHWRPGRYALNSVPYILVK
jgi:hypothetical protein